MWTLGAWVPSRTVVSRFFKYLLLVVALAATLKVVFDGFSFYLARRTLDAELESKKIPSLEFLIVQTRRERALIIETLETRCLERNELALFRIGDAELSRRLWEAYKAATAIKDSLIYHARRLDSAVASKINVPGFVDEVNQAKFTMSKIDRIITPAQGVRKDSPEFQEAARRAIEVLRAAVSDQEGKLLAYAQLDREVREKLGSNSRELKRIEILEQRLKRLNEERQRTRQKHPDLGDLLSRYAVWTEALTGGAAENPILDEMVFQLEEADKSRLDSVNCTHLEAFYSKVNNRPFSKEQFNEKRWDRMSFAEKMWYYPSRVAEFYREVLHDYFRIPPVAQTLFVTLFLGALGALTISVLRLSKIGWWAPQTDPPWGEIVLSPFIGALAAFGIFLLGSTGLLLASDFKASQSGATSLSAFFIGLLGFVSGLLYDEAFGRVRRVGSQLFAGDSRPTATSPEDRSLADLLKTAGALLAADLMLKFGIGSRISAEPEFTLLVPSDEAMGRFTVKGWREISEPATRSKFEQWFRAHHALRRVTSNDVPGGSIGEIQAEDGTTYRVQIDADGLKINDIKATKKDIPWGNGVIHILEKDVLDGA